MWLWQQQWSNPINDLVNIVKNIIKDNAISSFPDFPKCDQ